METRVLSGAAIVHHLPLTRRPISKPSAARYHAAVRATSSTTKEGATSVITGRVLIVTGLMPCGEPDSRWSARVSACVRTLLST